MRKYKRAIYHAYARKNGLKESKFVGDSWDNYQIRKIGRSARRMNQRHGTKPRWKWRAA